MVRKNIKKNFGSRKRTKSSSSKAHNAVAKKAVKQVRQNTVEAKDRIGTIRNFALTSNTGSSLNGPKNSITFCPQSLFSPLTQGTANGQVNGGQITPKYLNMKVRLSFDKLPAFAKAGVAQSYNIHIYQCEIQRTLKDAGYLRSTVVNSESNRTQPAFASDVVVGDILTFATDQSKQILFNARLQSDFLSYDKKTNDNLKIIKNWRVLGDTTARLQSAILANSDATVSPEKQYSFNWRMPQVKRQLSPLSGEGLTTEFAPASVWIPCICVTMETRANLEAGQELVIDVIDHFTYTDS